MVCVGGWVGDGGLDDVGGGMDEESWVCRLDVFVLAGSTLKRAAQSDDA